jgi:hypothetical protein
MLTVAMVYRSGGDFNEKYVRDLAVGINRNLMVPHKTICLTNKPSAYLRESVDELIRLSHGWPGWWAKMELFGLKEPVLYFDLDTVIKGNIDELARSVEALPSDSLMMLRGFYESDQCSGIMGWNRDMTWLHSLFCEVELGKSGFESRGNYASLATAHEYYRGDQDFIKEMVKTDKRCKVVLAQDIFKGIYSYKVDIMPVGKIPDDTRIIVFHGKPRPAEVTV